MTLLHTEWDKTCDFLRRNPRLVKALDLSLLVAACVLFLGAVLVLALVQHASSNVVANTLVGTTIATNLIAVARRVLYAAYNVDSSWDRKFRVSESVINNLRAMQ